MAESTVLDWRYYPGIVEAGRRAAQDDATIADNPHDLGSPQHLAWTRGFLPTCRDRRPTRGTS